MTQTGHDEAGRRCGRIAVEHRKGYGMTSMAQRIKGALNRPQRRRLIQRGRQQAAKPGTQQKLRQLGQRITGRSAQGR